MPKILIFSQRLLKSQAALAEMTIQEVNERAGFSPNYIHRLYGRENIQLNTINRIAHAIGCHSSDLMEEVEIEVTPDTQAKAPVQEELIAV